MLILLLACAHRPLYVEPPALQIPPQRSTVATPGDCRGEYVDPGIALDCTGIAISVAQSELVELLEGDLRLVTTRLVDERAARLQDRALAERLDAERIRAEREAAVGRWAVPVAFVGGGLVVAGAWWAVSQ